MRKGDLNSQLENCNFIKTILMSLVVLYHSCALWKSGGWFNQAPASPSAFLDVIAQWLNSFHVYGFTFVSGFIFYALKNEKGKYQDKKAFVIGKVKRLIVPYVLVSTLWAGPWYVFYFKASLGDVLKNFVLGVQPAQLWFLLMLFWVFMIAIILPDSSIVLLIVSLVLYGIGFVGGMIIPNVLQIFTGCQYFIFFAIGCIIAKELSGDETSISKIHTLFRNPIWMIFLDIAIFAVYMLLGTLDLAVFKLVRLCVEAILHVVGALMAFGVLGWIANRVDWKKSRVFMLLSKHNFIIYLLHQQIIYGVITLFNGEVASGVLVAMNFVVSVLITLLLAIVIERLLKHEER